MTGVMLEGKVRVRDPAPESDGGPVGRAGAAHPGSARVRLDVTEEFRDRSSGLSGRPVRKCSLNPFPPRIRQSHHRGDGVKDQVSVDAKRILLRYGAPIAVLDDVPEKERVEFARIIARTELSDRQEKLRDLLKERGYMEGDDD